MANDNIQLLKQELENNARELSRFRTLVEYLSNAGNELEQSKQTLTETHTFYANKVKELAQIAKELDSFKKAANELAKKLEKENFNNRFGEVDAKLSSVSQNLAETENTLQQEIAEVIEAIKSLDLPSKFNNVIEGQHQLTSITNQHNETQVNALVAFKKETENGLEEVFKQLDGLNNKLKKTYILVAIVMVISIISFFILISILFYI